MKMSLPILAGLSLLAVGTTAQADETLAAQLEARAAQSAERMPAAIIETMQTATFDLKATGIEKAARQVGQKAPDFTLPAAGGGDVSLAALRQEGPVVLAFYRGGWCPYCNLQLAALQAELPALQEAGASLVAISPESPASAEDTKSAQELDYAVVTDADNAYARELGLVFALPQAIADLYANFGIKMEPKVDAPGTYELPVAALYVIDTDSTISWAFIDADYTRRAEPSDVVAAVKAL